MDFLQLLEAGWLPSELTPTVAAEENMDVVEVMSPRIGSGFPGHPWMLVASRPLGDDNLDPVSEDQR